MASLNYFLCGEAAGFPIIIFGPIIIIGKNKNTSFVLLASAAVAYPIKLNTVTLSHKLR